MLKIDELYLFGSRAQTNVPEFEGKRDSANISSMILLYMNCFPGRNNDLPDYVTFAIFYPFLIWFFQSSVIPLMNTKSIGIGMILFGIWLFNK